MRIDKLLCELNLGTRSQIKEQIRKGQVSVNGKIQKDPGTKVDEKNDVILLNGKGSCISLMYIIFCISLRGALPLPEIQRNRLSWTSFVTASGRSRKESFPGSP